jgi:tetratricopeptide (TPR) repeat protein
MSKFKLPKTVIDKIKSLNFSVDKYKKETVIQSLPTVACVNRAKKLIEAIKFEEAKEILLGALELPHKDPLVYKYLGMVYDSLKDFENAAQAYQTSADLNPHDKLIWQKLGFALISLNKYVEAEKSFENASKIMQGNTDTYTGWGMALMKLGRYKEADDKFIKAVQANKYNFPAIFLSAVMDVKLGVYDKADSKLAFLNRVCPNEGHAYEYANLKFIKGDLNNAKFYAQKALEYNPGMLPAYILLGDIYTINNDKEQALGCFETAYGKELINTALYLGWSTALIKFGMYEDARTKVLQGLVAGPDSAELKTQLALCHALAGSIDAAKECLGEQTNPQIAGIIAFAEGDNDKAIKLLRETLEEENSYISHYYLAKAYGGNGKNDEKVREHYDCALEKNPLYMKARLDYARYLIAKEDYAAARRKLRAAIKADRPELLNLLFFASYMLVKDDNCGYNIKDTLAIAAQIPEELFEYKEERAELQRREYDE